MRVAVIGAGLAGVTTAQALAGAGHEVTVYERRSSVAEEASFAPLGLAAAALAAPWQSTGHGAVRAGSVWTPPSFWRRRSAAQETRRQDAARALYRLVAAGSALIEAQAAPQDSRFEPGAGLMLLVDGRRETAQAETAAAWLAELGEPVEWLDEERRQRLEPALAPLGAGQRAAYLPRARLGNPREWVHGLRAAAQQDGAQFLFLQNVTGVTPGPRPRVAHVEKSAAAGEAEFDAVIVCAGQEAARLLAPLGLRLPLIFSHGASVTAPMPAGAAAFDRTPRGAVLDLRSGIGIARMGSRLRVAGGDEAGPAPSALPPDRRLQPLYRALDARFPGAAHWPQAQAWQGTRASLTDGLPAVGPSGLPGLWLNLGHGAHGWALGAASAQALAEQLGGLAPTHAAEFALLAPTRWQ